MRLGVVLTGAGACAAASAGALTWLLDAGVSPCAVCGMQAAAWPAALYLAGGLVVLIARIRYIPETFGMIFRYAFRPDAIIGASCYDQLQLAQRAVAAGASYVAFGAFFPSRSKATTRRAHPQLLRDATALGVPRVAIGGLTADNSTALVEAGADLLAVISGVFAADDPLAALCAYRACFDVAPTPARP